ncbi:MAG: hypothetical protein RJA22_677 [Verrucomicrobiota bacterium]
MKTTIVLFLAGGLLSASAGLSKLDALAMIESGNDDAAIGRAGEVSRYQIKPRIWQAYTTSRAWRNAGISGQVAGQYLAHLEDLFRRRTGRDASDFDLYVLWNAGPSYYARLGYSARRVGPTIRDRAQRYVNLRHMRNAFPPHSPPPAPPAPLAAPFTTPLPPLPTPPAALGLTLTR